MKARTFAVAMLAFSGQAAVVTAAPIMDSSRASAKAAHEQLLKAADSTTFQQAFLKSDPLLSIYTPTHSRYLLGNISQMQAFDVDRDGQLEIITTASFQGDSRIAYSVLAAEAGSKDYRISRQSEELANHGEILLAYHLPESAEPVALVSANNRLKLLSLEDFQPVAEQTESSWSQQAALADVTGDGVVELIVRGGGNIQLLDPVTLAVNASTYAYSMVAMGNLDATPEPELLSVDSRYVDGNYRYFLQIHGFNGTEITLKQEHALSDYGWNAQLVDTDLDGINEIIQRTNSGMQVLDAVTGAVRWSETGHYYYDFRPLGVVDVDGNGVPDLMLPDRTDSKRLAFHSSKTGEQIRSIEVTQGQLLQAVALGDGEALVLSNANYYNSPQTLSRISLEDGAAQWTSTESGSAVAFVGLAKQDQADALLVSVTGQSGYGAAYGATIRLQQHADLAEADQLTLVADDAQPVRIYSATTADINGDGNDELLLVALRNDKTVVYVVNLQTLSARWFIVDGNSYNGFAITPVDLENDGKQEVVVASPGRLLLVDAEHGALLGQAINPDYYYYAEPGQVVVTDIDGDSVLDAFVSGSANQNIAHFLVKAEPEFVRNIATTGSVHSMALLDVGADDRGELLIGTNAGKLLALDSANLQWSTVAAPCSGALSAIKALTNEQLLMVCGRQAAIYDTLTQAARWVDADLPTYIFNSSGIAFDDAPVNKTLFLAGGRINRVGYLGHVRRPTAHPMVVRTHWRDALNGSFLVTNPNPELALAANLMVEASAGSVTLATDGSLQFQYTPSGASLAADQFRYSVSNGYLESEPAVVTIERSNNAPVAFATNVAVKAGKSIGGSINAKDVDADPLQWQIKTQPKLGTVSIDEATGTFSYSANKDASGSDSFTVTVSDGVSSTDADVAVTVTKKSSSGGGGSAALLLLALLAFAVAVRRQPQARR